MDKTDWKFSSLLNKQRTYNAMIRALEDNDDPIEWTKTFLIGMVSEIDSVLNELEWKRHRKRKGSKVNLVNLAYEFADLTKYVLSLWEVWGFNEDEILGYCVEKSEMLDQILVQEFSEIPNDRPILITDIDGTLGDWRKSFMLWASEHNYFMQSTDPVTSLMIDEDLAMRYVDYYNSKEEFERKGGYRNIVPYLDAIETVQALQDDMNAYIIVTTARPVDRYHRIWLDSWIWLKAQNLTVDQLIIGAEPRILLAHQLNHEKDCEVIMFEDNPGLILRAANSGILVFARRQPYNASIKHENVRHVDKYTELSPSDYFRRGA